MSNQPTRERQRKRPKSISGHPKKSTADDATSASSEPLSGTSESGPDEDSSDDGSFAWKPIAAIIAAAAIGFTVFFGFGSGDVVDMVAKAEIQSRIAAYETLITGPGFPLAQVAPEDIEQAISDMPQNVSAEQRKELRSNINQGRVKLAWLTLWDTHVEDGDILRFESTSTFPIEVTALNAKTTIAIPFPADGNVVVTGVRDGGGGITIALESGAAHVAWPTMAPGDTLNLPVTPSY